MCYLLEPLTERQWEQLEAVVTFAIERYEEPVKPLHPSQQAYKRDLEELLALIRRAHTSSAGRS